jgi:type IV secretion system protein VirB9
MIPRSLMAGTSLVLALAAAAPAFALEKTSPSRRDQNIRFVVYDPDNVVPLKTTMGTALMVTFAPDEHIVKVAVSDSARLMTDVVKDSNQRLANYLFLKPIALKEDPPGYVLPAQPLMVITERKGTLRHYQFLFQAQPAGGDPDYAVVFTYPHDAYMQRLAEARERQRRAEAAQTRGLLRRETKLASSTGGFDGSRNYRYAARGDAQIAPAWVWDTGYSTYFYWPAITRIPSIFRGACGAGEATADSSTHSDTVIVPGTAPIWCLRDQRSAVEIYNLGYTTAGATPNTGTISPYVERTVTDGH